MITPGDGMRLSDLYDIMQENVNSFGTTLFWVGHWAAWTKPGGTFARACGLEIREQNAWSDGAQKWLAAATDPGQFLFVPEQPEGLRDYQRRTAAIHLLAAHALIESPTASASEVIKVIRDGLAAHAPSDDEPDAFLRDLTAELTTEIVSRDAPEVVASTKTVTLAANLMRPREPGTPLYLYCELLRPGTGELYRHPRMAFVFRERSFRDAERNMRAYLKDIEYWPADLDIRWSFLGIEDTEIRSLSGHSAGAAFGAAILSLIVAARAD